MLNRIPKAHLYEKESRKKEFGFKNWEMFPDCAEAHLCLPACILSMPHSSDCMSMPVRRTRLPAAIMSAETFMSTVVICGAPFAGVLFSFGTL